MGEGDSERNCSSQFFIAAVRYRRKISTHGHSACCVLDHDKSGHHGGKKEEWRHSPHRIQETGKTRKNLGQDMASKDRHQAIYFLQAPPKVPILSQ